MKRRHFFLLTLVFLVGLVALDVALVCNPPKIRALISAELEGSVKVPIDYGHISPSGISGIRVTDVKIWRDEERSDLVLECSALIATLDIRKLLESEIRVDRVELIDPVVYLEWNEDKDLDLPAVFEDSRSEKRAASIPEVAIRGLEVAFKNAPIWDDGADVRIRGIDLQLTPRRSKVFPYSFEGTVDDDVFGRFEMRGDFGTRARGVVERKGFRLEERQVARLSPELKETIGQISMEGAIDIEVAIESEDLLAGVDYEVTATARDVRLRHTRWPAEVDDLNGRIRVNPNRVLAEDLEMRLDGAMVRFEKGVVDLKADDFIFDMRGRATGWLIDRDFAERLRAYPDNPMKDVREAIAAFDIDGPVDFDFSVGRRIGRDRVEVEFDVDLREVDLRYLGYRDRVSGRRNGYPYPIERALGRVRITNDLLEFHDLHSAVRSPDFQADGRVEFGNTKHGIGVDLEITGRDFKLDERVAATLPPKDREVLDSYAPEGAVDFDLVVRREPDRAGPPFVRLVVDLDGITATPAPFPYLLHDLEGRLVFDDGPTRVLGVTARHGSTSITVDGEVDLASTVREPYYELHIDAEAVEIDDDLLAGLSREFPELASEVRRFNFEGNVDFRCSIDSRGEGARNRYNIGMNGLAFRYDLMPEVRATDLRGRLVAEGDRLVIESGTSLRCAGGVFDATGWIGIGQDGAHDVDLSCDELILDAKSMATITSAAPELEAVDEAVEIRGPISLGVRMKRTTRGALRKFRATAKGLTVSGRQAPFLVSDVFGTLESRGDTVSFDTWTGLVRLGEKAGGDPDNLVLGVRRGHFGARRGESRLILDGVSFTNLSLEERTFELLPSGLVAKIRELGLRGRIDGHLDSVVQRGKSTRITGRLQPTDVFLEPGISVGFHRGIIHLEDAAFGPDLFEVKGKIEDSDLLLYRFGLQDVEAHFEIDEEAFAVRGVSGRTVGGRLDSSNTLFIMNFAGAQAFQASISLSEADLSKFIEELGGNPRTMKGGASGWIAIEGDLADTATWNGDGEFRLGGRRLYDLPFFAVVFQLINFDFITSPTSNQTGLLKLSIADEKIVLDEADFRGPGINLDGKGEVGFDGICRIEFDPEIVKWLDPVPLVGDVVDFIRGFVASRILVTGPLEDPKAVALNHITEILPAEEDSGRRLKIKPLKTDDDK